MDFVLEALPVRKWLNLQKRGSRATIKICHLEEPILDISETPGITAPSLAEVERELLWVRCELWDQEGCGIGVGFIRELFRFGLE